MFVSEIPEVCVTSRRTLMVVSRFEMHLRANAVRRFAYLFFFSSRRRHTRCLSDWSSDVCSSDLRHRQEGRVPREDLGRGQGRRQGHHRGDREGQPRAEGAQEVAGGGQQGAPRALRSEERRVGKECRSRRSQEQKKKKRQVEEGSG